MYDAYGVSASASADPFGFGGQVGYYTDAETGLQLCQHRYYDSSTGRFVNRDPAGYVGGLNLYGYCTNNPVTGADPSGFCNDERDANPFNLFNPVDAFGMSQDGWTRAGDGTGSIPAAMATTALAGLSIYGAAKGLVMGGVGLVTAGYRNIAGLVAIGADLVASGKNAALDGTEIVYRAMSQAELDSTQATGLMRGGRSGTHFASDASYTDALRARQRLALAQTPELEVKLQVPAGRFSSPSTVEPLYNMPGGGMERAASGNVPVTVLNVRVLK